MNEPRANYTNPDIKRDSLMIIQLPGNKIHSEIDKIIRI